MVRWLFFLLGLGRANLMLTSFLPLLPRCTLWKLQLTTPTKINMDPNNSWFVKKHFQVPCQFVWGTLHMLNWLKLSSIKTFLPTLIACDKKVRQPALLLREKIGCHATLSGAETLAQQCLLVVLSSKNPVVQTAIVKNPCSEKHESQLRDVFTNQPTCLWQCFVFLKG